MAEAIKISKWSDGIMKEIAVVAAKRSPVGKIPGELNYIDETELLSCLIKSVVDKMPVVKIDEAVLGASFPSEKDNLCRKAILKAGLSSSISASTISKTCASSDEALAIAFSKIACGQSNSVLVGGSEKISNSPYILHFMKRNIKRLIKNQLPEYDEMISNIEENDMTYISEVLAKEQHITRKDQDEYTIQSILKAKSANELGYFKQEICPIRYDADGKSYSLDKDEWLCYERSREEIYQVPSMFVKNGTVTQYNAAPNADCACVMLLMDKQMAIQCGLQPMVLIRSIDCTSVEKKRRGYAMEESVKNLLKKEHLNTDDIDLFEINESFAAQTISVIQQLNLVPTKVNVNGGNLAIGYPIGTSGLRMIITLVHQLIRTKKRYGVSVMCAGGNMANSVLLENVNR